VTLQPQATLMEEGFKRYFYNRCNEILAEAEFDETVEMLCQPPSAGRRRTSSPRARAAVPMEWPCL